MPTFRVRAKINGQVRRSWGESANETAAREKASAQLAKITSDFEILSVEEIESVQADAEDILAHMLDVDRIDIP